jgi:negative regulator of flagellin synthesis FlgM
MMKINPPVDGSSKEIGDRLNRGLGAAAGASAGTPAHSSAAVEAVNAAAASEKIQLSEASQALNRLSIEPFDAAKVAQIRKAISEGRFNVNAEIVADRMIGDAAELMTTIFSGQSNSGS